ncbi:helix-turn-helix domain-containing protein [Calderihabitans maritimus]|uniref:Helix-turn-helix domain-containing protein n=1 Tax=Calderihabitans maritimus TaxID=1246530 RepID=A0A1Z5HNR0_9FIRM|nr:helix-turn-helix transcriptional regulator [Calderihabitans maritimus]GAW91172.1 helix-turn-helix domain-containing protein [Calderihabitans maritimus]
MKPLSERLAALRREKGLSQAELAKQLNMGQSTIAMYERNRRTPDPETLERLADFFNVSVDYLLGRTDYRGKPEPKYLGEVREQDNIPFEPKLRQALTDPLFADLLKRITDLTQEEKESLAEYWDWALRVIEKERERRKKALTNEKNSTS